MLLRSLGKTAEELGKNDTGVAPRTLERAPGNRRGDHRSIRRVHSGELLNGADHCQRHIGARIAVGHRENVQRVNGSLMLFQHPGAIDDHLL